MMLPRSPQLPKSRFGIQGLDDITGGGLPTGRSTLLAGGPGCGKTVLALQTLITGAREKEPGIFVAFEESSGRIVANASQFGWDIPALEKKNLFFLDAQPTTDIVLSGDFDLGGMLAALDNKVKEMGAKRIVFDAIDVVLALLNDSRAERRELYRLHEWILSRGITAIITAKYDEYPGNGYLNELSGNLQFMVDCVINLRHHVEDGISHRMLRVIKYRGSAFGENDTPMIISNTGIEVATLQEITSNGSVASDERVSSGVERLDTMLGGGYFRNAGILITGSPGTAKSTLCGAFLEAACSRGERSIFVSFDSLPNEILRNLASVNIRLERFVKSGLLKVLPLRKGTARAEVHFMTIKADAKAHGARCLVIDPISSLSKLGDQVAVHSVVERLTDWAKFEDITLLSTSLLHGDKPQFESFPLQISTIADTWIHLSYLVLGGERNRALTIVKSRGTSHSNQVRELLLDSKEVTLADVYSSNGEVLMGTLRWQREEKERIANAEQKENAKHALAQIQREELELATRANELQRELLAKRAERESMMKAGEASVEAASTGTSTNRSLRSADSTPPSHKSRKS